MKYRLIGIVVTAIVTVGALTALSGIALAEGPPDEGHRSSSGYAPYGGQNTASGYALYGGQSTAVGKYVSVEQTVAAALLSAFGCDYTTHSDNPHKSGNEVSVHGWWTKSPGSSCPRYAYVTVELEAYYCHWRSGCWWVAQSVNSDRVRSGEGGRGRRVAARFPCVSNNLVGWRSIVDVDLEGQIDMPLIVSRAANVECSPER